MFDFERSKGCGPQRERKCADQLPVQKRLVIMQGDLIFHALLGARASTVAVRLIDRRHSARSTLETRIVEEQGTTRGPVRGLR